VTDCLSWQPGGKPLRHALTRFECSLRAPQLSSATGWVDKHPLWWEREVQRRVRALRIPVSYPWGSLLATDGQGVAAVSYWEHLDEGHVHLTYLAVALRWRFAGSAVAHELVDRTLDVLTDRAIQDAVRSVKVTARVWYENRPSQRLCEWASMSRTGYVDQGLELWSGVLPVDDPTGGLW